MENWQKDLMTVLEDANKEWEKFFHNLDLVVETVRADFSQALDRVVGEIQDNFNQEVDLVLKEVDRVLEELLEPLVDVEYEFEETTFIAPEFNNLDPDFEHPKLKPNSTLHPACVGCRHYHGRSYGGNMLVCGMHPYGWDDRHCPDWEEE
jgi:hypothetical protein